MAWIEPVRCDGEEGRVVACGTGLHPPGGWVDHPLCSSSRGPRRQPGDVAIQACGCGLCRTCGPGLLRLRLAMTVEGCERGLSFPEIPAFAGMTEFGRTFPLAFQQKRMRPARFRHLVGCGDGACRPWGLRPRDACLQPSCAQASGPVVAAEFPVGWLGKSPWKVPPPASPGATPHDADPKPRYWPEVTP